MVAEGMNRVHAPIVVLLLTKNLKLFTQLTATFRVLVGDNGLNRSKMLVRLC